MAIRGSELMLENHFKSEKLHMAIRGSESVLEKQTKYKLKSHKRQSDGYFAYVDQENEGPEVGWEKRPREQLVIFYKKSIMKCDEYKSDWRIFVTDRLVQRYLHDSRTGYEIVMEGDDQLIQCDVEGKLYSVGDGDTENLQQSEINASQFYGG